MTLVATTLRTAYLAGPMRGYDENNFPAFHKAADWLRSQGWSIFSPAERDEADPALNGDWQVSAQRGLDYFMQYDLAAVAQTDCVIAMKGWEKSQGARLETNVAVELGHPVFELVVGHFGRRRLESVNPSYVQSIFALNAVAGPLHAEAGTFDPGCGCNCPEPEAEQEPEEPTVTSWDELADFVEIPPEVAEGLARLLAKPSVFVSNDPTYPEGIQLDAGPIDQGPSWRDEKAVLPGDTASRKSLPVATGVLDYFPAALVEVAKVSKAGNDKHNPGQPLHHARGKSTDHADALTRHLLDRGGIDAETGMRHSAEMAWRALALLQQELEDAGLAPLARGAREEVTE